VGGKRKDLALVRTHIPHSLTLLERLILLSSFARLITLNALTASDEITDEQSRQVRSIFLGSTVSREDADRLAVLLRCSSTSSRRTTSSSGACRVGRREEEIRTRSALVEGAASPLDLLFAGELSSIRSDRDVDEA